MEALWEIVRAGGPYVKVAEYTLIFLTLIASIYASNRTRARANEIKRVGDGLDASAEKLRMLSQEVLADLERRSHDWLASVKAQTADRVEAVDHAPAGSPQVTVAVPGNDAQPPSTDDDPREAHTKWWQPIVDMKFDDPDQEQPTLHWKNNTRTHLPWPGTWLTTWRNESPDGVCGVALSGRADSLEDLWPRLRREARQIERELPDGSTVSEGRFGIGLLRPNSEFRDDDERRAWMKATLNKFVNVLRPRMTKLAQKASG
jgi:hypothetical protein